MLRIGVGTNIWNPPELAYDEYKEYVLQTENIDCESAFLLIFKISPYIDALYLGLTEDGERLEKRFSFHEGYIWDAETEYFFIEKCLKGNCTCDSKIITQIYNYYSENYPDWKIKRYITNKIKLLDHIYHCMQKDTAKEILYKAGLDGLAEHIDDLDEINLLANKPSDLYGGITMRALKALNSATGSSLIASKYNREFIKELAARFADVFKNKLNEAQCMYLKRLIDGELTVGEAGRLFLSRKAALSSVWTKSQFDIFIAKEKNNDIAGKTLKELNKIDPLYMNAFDYRTDRNEFPDTRIWILKSYLIDNRQEYDKMIRQANRRRNKSLQERGDDYIVRFPQTINDFCREAIYMSNCLLAYAEAFMCNDTDILLMRDANDVNKPFITIEIFKGELRQAYHRYNEDCTKEEADWIRAYCIRHGIGTNLFFFDNNVDLL